MPQNCLPLAKIGLCGELARWLLSSCRTYAARSLYLEQEDKQPKHEAWSSLCTHKAHPNSHERSDRDVQESENAPAIDTR